MVRRKIKQAIDPCPKEYKQLLEQRTGWINYTRVRVVIFGLYLLAAYFFYTDVRSLVQVDGAVSRQFLYIDIFLVVFLTVYVLLMVFFRPRREEDITPLHRLFEGLFAFVLLNWSAVVAVYEQLIAHTISTYVIAILAVAVLFITRIYIILPLYGVSVLTLYLTFRIVLPSERIFFEEFPALFGLLIMGVVVSLLMYYAYVHQFVAEKRLSDAKDQLEEKNRKLEQTQLKLIQQEKLATIGQLAAGIAHEINNPLSFIKSNVSALRQRLVSIKTILYDCISKYRSLAASEIPPEAVSAASNERPTISIEEVLELTEELDEIIEDTRHGIRRVTDVVGNLLDFSRDKISNRIEAYDLHKGIESTLNIARNEFKYVAEIKKQFGEIPLINCRGGEINQVLLNLLTNAAYAVKKRFGRSGKRTGIIVDETGESDGSETLTGIISIRTKVEKGAVLCDIYNNGIPIPEEHRDVIFEPFFTSKDAGEGTGLGLSIAKDIVEHRHNGRLTLLQSDWNGTTFRVRLPIQQDDTVT